MTDNEEKTPEEIEEERAALEEYLKDKIPAEIKTGDEILDEIFERRIKK